MENNALLLEYDLSRRATVLNRNKLLPHPFDWGDLEEQHKELLKEVAVKDAVLGNSENASDTEDEYCCKYPYTPMPPEPHGYIKVSSYDPY